MSKMHDLKKQIACCANDVEQQQIEYLKLKQQFIDNEEYKPLLPLVCGAVFLIGFLYVVSPRVRHFTATTSKLAFNIAIKSGITLHSFARLL